jgi:hypothetical protein
MQSITRWVFLALTALATVCVPRASYAQQMNFSYYSDYYYSDDGSLVYTIVDGSDNSTGCSHYNYQTTGYAYAPSGYYSQSSGGLSSYVGFPVDAGDFNFSWGSDVVVDCSCFGPDLGAGGGSSSSSVLPIPTGEQSNPNAWAAWPQDTVFKWWAQLTSNTGASFVARSLQEIDGGSPVDTCFQSAPNACGPEDRALISHGGWTVDGSNQYHDDLVGVYPDAVLCYRSANASPCRFENNQVMQINQVGGRWVTYKTNRLKMGMDGTGVWSERDGYQPAPWKAWP